MKKSWRTEVRWTSWPWTGRRTLSTYYGTRSPDGWNVLELHHPWTTQSAESWVEYLQAPLANFLLGTFCMHLQLTTVVSGMGLFQYHLKYQLTHWWKNAADTLKPQVREGRTHILMTVRASVNAQWLSDVLPHTQTVSDYHYVTVTTSPAMQ